MGAMQHRRRILVIVQAAQAYGRSILHGLLQEARRFPAWELLFDTLREPDLNSHTNRPVDGIISEYGDDARADWLAGRGVPTVVISGPARVPGCGWVRIDNERVGQIAFEHLFERGLRQFAVAGYRDSFSSQQRLAGFRAAAIQRGIDAAAISVHQVSHFPGDFVAERPELIPWVRSLLKPVGVFATTLDHARNVSLACEEAQVHVPDEIALIGCNHDPLTAEMAHPPLTSIDHGALDLGVQAVRLLARLLDGEPVPDEPVVVEPIGITLRQSTDLQAVSNRHVARAMRLIRERASMGLTVEQLLAEIPLGRRAFELAFRSHIGRSPHQQIIRTRLDHACQLLRTTTLSLPLIAEACGYRYAAQFSAAFKKHLGIAPSAYRAGEPTVTKK